MSVDEIKNELIWKKFPVLDDGFVTLVDVMGDDSSVVQAARVSYGKGTKTSSDDRTLIRYLMRNRHTTPFEMAEVKLLIRIPMDAWRQYVRHRTASINEYSTRYSEAIDSQQKTKPEEWRLQSTTNKQGSELVNGLIPWPEDEFKNHYNNTGDATASEFLTKTEAIFHKSAIDLYQSRLKLGVAREQARKDLPLSNYTEAYWKVDLHNLLHFLSLRMDSHAQKEIRDYANIIGYEIVAKLFPLTWEAFQDYRMNSMTLSGLEVEYLRKYLIEVTDRELAQYDDLLQDSLIKTQPEEWSKLKNCRERDEFNKKLELLGLK